MVNALRIHPDDNVACLLTDLRAGDRIVTTQGPGPALASAVRTGHKVALAGIAAGGAVIKYGQPIGTAIADIVPGDHVHVHNLKGAKR